jgi:uridine phosphorylase
MNLRVIESVISERDIYHSKNNNMDKPRVIPASELIINDDGSAFHIHLRPDQLRDNIILVGDPGRVDMVASYFDKIDYDVHSREFHAIAGTYKGKELMCISHGIGPDNIEIVVTELDALANVDFKTREVKPEHRTLRMVRVGTSGSLQEDLRIGDFVMAEKGMGFDGILNFYADRDRVCDLDFEREFCEHVNWDPSWAAPYTVDADPGLIDEIGRDDMRRGYTIAAVGFYAPQGRMVRLKLADPELNKKIESFRYKGRPITNFEMESACLQGMAKMLGHKAMTVCCIIAERRATTANTDYKPHVRRLIETVLDRI